MPSSCRSSRCRAASGSSWAAWASRCLVGHPGGPLAHRGVAHHDEAPRLGVPDRRGLVAGRAGPARAPPPARGRAGSGGCPGARRCTSYEARSRSACGNAQRGPGRRPARPPTWRHRSAAPGAGQRHAVTVATASPPYAPAMDISRSTESPPPPSGLGAGQRPAGMGALSPENAGGHWQGWRDRPGAGRASGATTATGGGAGHQRAREEVRAGQRVRLRVSSYRHTGRRAGPTDHRAADGGCTVTESWADRRPGWFKGPAGLVTGGDGPRGATRGRHRPHPRRSALEANWRKGRLPGVLLWPLSSRCRTGAMLSEQRYAYAAATTVSRVASHRVREEEERDRSSRSCLRACTSSPASAFAPTTIALVPLSSGITGSSSPQRRPSRSQPAVPHVRAGPDGPGPHATPASWSRAHRQPPGPTSSTAGRRGPARPRLRRHRTSRAEAEAHPDQPADPLRAAHRSPPRCPPDRRRRRAHCRSPVSFPGHRPSPLPAPVPDIIADPWRLVRPPAHAAPRPAPVGPLLRVGADACRR